VFLSDFAFLFDKLNKDFFVLAPVFENYSTGREQSGKSDKMHVFIWDLVPFLRLFQNLNNFRIIGQLVL